jgi:polyferredoxin
MKRQKIRKALLLISFLLFPVTIYYFSPMLILQGAWEGIVVGCLVIFLTLFLLSLFLGRVFCSYICPIGGLQECLMLTQKKKAKGGRLNWIKYFIWVPWLGSIVFFFIKAGGFLAFDFLYVTTYGISIDEPMAYVIYFGVIALVVILSLTKGKRAFCHYVCWIAPFMVLGTKISGLLRLPSLRLKSNKEKCIGCKKCSDNCPMSLNVEEMIKKENMKNSECILCGECIDTCPKKVIGYTMKKDKKDGQNAG